MKGKRVKTYMATLMADKKFREKFDQQYQNLCISESQNKLNFLSPAMNGGEYLLLGRTKPRIISSK